MEKRLVKVAKEFNVGVSTVVEHLHKAGFDVDNKPTAKISDEMYQELMREFKKSMDIKEQADQLVLGNRTPAKEVPVEKPAEKVVQKVEAKPVDVPATPVEESAPVVEETAPEESSEGVFRVKHEAKLKVVGKIDLTPKPRPAAKKKAADPKPEPVKEPIAKKEQPAEPVVEGTSAPAEETAPPVVAEENKLIKAEAPQLKGLKILGKIDASKFGPKKKEAKPE